MVEGEDQTVKSSLVKLMTPLPSQVGAAFSEVNLPWTSFG